MLEELLLQYADTFGENFPVFEYSGYNGAQIAEIIKECIKRGKPVETDAENGRIY